MPFSALFYLRANAKSVGKKLTIMGKYKLNFELSNDFSYAFYTVLCTVA